MRERAWLMMLVAGVLGCRPERAPLPGPTPRAQPAPTPAPQFSVPRPEYRSRGPKDAPQRSRGLYLDLLKMTLTDLIYESSQEVIAKRALGHDWPGRAHTMIGLKRLDNLHDLMEDVLARGVPGDFLEAGAWRGGATIFMRAVLKDHGVTDRLVWVADSFEGLPPPDPKKYPADLGSKYHEDQELAVSLEHVKANFERYGLLDEQVRFLKGWFKDTFPTAPIEQLAILRLDGDMYESTMDSLRPLYPKLARGGYLIIDDYSIPACRRAIEDYRREHGITEEMKTVDWTGRYWRKQR